MDAILFDFIIALIPIIGAIITRYIVPFIKTRIAAAELEVAMNWVNKAVLAAEVLFKAPGSGELKREYVINFINEKINKNKVVITEEQIRVLLEAAWAETIKAKDGD